ncbi:pentatricopeptide repeat-containing protein At5g66520-like [Cornus florida]|uniref:pentatricopeptide repeat-containing protein At5g66520-like n=1 Tax=Cornus florida TaxID=4283 RepID=UPI0028A0B9A4|nr:pentatricopeptide repeat-containing protein At5g66520-like [Cornus florida]XP_059625713.1 pentatricopeptide repeat-containing protein At5g66520-like [Cornus florida]XP_059625714.1 pentatricopeptide repeat-containing protein At5g66520-like [Cornus florida]
MRPPLPNINHTTNRIIHLLDNCTSPAHIHQIQAQLILQTLHSDTTIAHHFITACQSLGLLDSAHLFYTQLQRPHVFICNNLIRALSHKHFPLKSISIYNHMNRNSILPNNYTFPFILKSLSDLRDLKQGQCIHTQIIKLGHFNDIYVQNSLLNVYAAGGNMDLCRQVFDEMPQRDVVSWTVMITGYREARKFDDALIAFMQMQYAGVVPNQVTMVNALSACSSVGAIDMGLWIHDFIRRSGWEMDVILGTSLIDMYGKFGRTKEGYGVFLSMKKKNVFTWNALLKGLALAESGEEALQWFLRMEQEGIEPNEFTLINVLCACSYSGMVQTGRQIFCSLIEGKYGFSPGVKHYTCMIDLLARAGCLEDAFKCIKEIPFEPTTAMWGALLAGCRAHGDLELSEFAAWKLIQLAPENSGYYVLLSNLYAEMERWKDVEKVRGLMKERGLKKDLGCSSVERGPQDISMSY